MSKKNNRKPMPIIQNLYSIVFTLENVFSFEEWNFIANVGFRITLSHFLCLYCASASMLVAENLDIHEA